MSITVKKIGYEIEGLRCVEMVMMATCMDIRVGRCGAYLANRYTHFSYSF